MSHCKGLYAENKRAEVHAVNMRIAWNAKVV